MPEGHSVHRLARQFRDIFVGKQLSVSSPQGRFSAGARLLDGHTLAASQAHGKHLFLEFSHNLFLHVHLGLYGAWNFGGDESFRGASSIGAPRTVGEQEVFDDGAPVIYAGPPEPVGAVRVRLVDSHGWADLREPQRVPSLRGGPRHGAQAVGPRPAEEPAGDRETFVRGLLARRTPIAALLMDQKVIAGVGNVYRAELLFRGRLNPWLPGKSLTPAAAEKLWDDAVSVMSDGARDGRIITTPSAYWSAGPHLLPDQEEAHFTYRRQGLDCRVCGTPIAMTELSARKLYWCPVCQQTG
ncbi:Fpg/Nei family DNA glycosylase [Arthrobacter sp. SA17]